MTTTTKTLQPGEAVTVRNGTGTSTPASVTIAPGDAYDISAAAGSPPPPPPPPPSGLWFAPPPITIPPDAKTYTGSGSLSAFLASIPAGGFGVLDYDGEIKENVSVTFRNGVMIYAKPGRRPWVRGDFRVRGGDLWKIWGLSVTFPEAAASDHVVDIKAGAGWEFAYGEVCKANCYTLIHPTGSVRNWRFHHLWVHDNLGVSSHDGNQDHGFYVSAPIANQNGRVDHCLVENMPRGRNIKCGGASSGSTIGGIEFDHNTLRLGHGPSNGQVSNGATDTRWHDNVLIDSGKSTSLTDGSGSKLGNTYSGNWSDRTTGPNSANFKDAGGNVVKSAATLADYAVNGAAGKGHLAP